MSRREPETEPVPVIVVRETAMAYLLRDRSQDEDGDEDSEEWFPKSQIHFEQRNVKTGKAIAIIPLWLLRDKGWNS